MTQFERDIARGYINAIEQYLQEGRIREAVNDLQSLKVVLDIGRQA